VTIRVMAKTLPLKQWDVARELRRRIKTRFDREGIEIPYPHQTVYWGEGQQPAAFAAPMLSRIGDAQVDAASFHSPPTDAGDDGE
jgi:small-conductance mechanosensitive channel